MRFEEYRKQDAISLAELIRKREVSAEEVLETSIARAEQVNPAVNAIVHKQYEQARKAVAAGLPEGPLNGVPYLIASGLQCPIASFCGAWVVSGTDFRCLPSASISAVEGRTVALWGCRIF